MFAGLHTVWNSLCGRYGFSAPEISAGWKAISERYTEPQRHYHTLVHLEELLTQYSLVESAKGLKDGGLSDPDSVLFTVFFHDIIYDPKAKDNEERSADLFEAFATRHNLPQPITQKVMSYILQTKTHLSVSESAPKDLHYFLDMDLSILGSSKERYMKYADEIRAEYKHYPHDLYQKGRAAVLKGFLGVPRLFKTDFFWERLEQRARSNLQWEIVRLRSPELAACKLNITDTAELKKLESSLRRDSLRLTDTGVTYCVVMNMDLCLAYKDRADRLLSYVLTTCVEDVTDYSMEQRELHEACLGSHLLLHTVVTQPDQRHRGLATGLINQLISMASERKMTKITTWCPKESAGYFAVLGFVQTRELPDVPCTTVLAASSSPSSGTAGSTSSFGAPASYTSFSSSPSTAAGGAGDAARVQTTAVEMSLNLLAMKS